MQGNDSTAARASKVWSRAGEDGSCDPSQRTAADRASTHPHERKPSGLFHHQVLQPDGHPETLHSVHLVRGPKKVKNELHESKRRSHHKHRAPSTVKAANSVQNTTSAQLTSLDGRRLHMPDATSLLGLAMLGQPNAPCISPSQAHVVLGKVATPPHAESCEAVRSEFCPLFPGPLLVRHGELRQAHH